MFIAAKGAKVQDGRQAQGQAEWSDRWVQCQDRQGLKTRRKRDWGRSELPQNRWLAGQTRQTGNRQTENTGINTQGIMGRWATPGGGWRQSQGQVKQIRV